MTKEKKVDLTADELFHVKEGLLGRIVCAPKSWDKEKVQDEANRKFGGPRTTQNEWVVAEEPLPEAWLKTETGTPGKCEDKNRCHWLLLC